MLADIVEQTNTQNAAGQMSRAWDYDNPVATVRCSARGILGGGIRVVGSTERWNTTYEDVEWVKLRTATQYSDRNRVSNIRDADGTLVWKKIDKSGNETASVFDVMGSTPVIDPFGAVKEYELLLKMVQDE